MGCCGSMGITPRCGAASREALLMSRKRQPNSQHPVISSLFTADTADHNVRAYDALPAKALTMILEIAQIDIKPGMESEFETGVKKAAPIFKRAKGCKFMTLQRSHEMPQRYRLFVQWETLENHTKDFRESPDFHEWRKLVGHCFSAPPNVEHVVEVMRGF